MTGQVFGRQPRINVFFVLPDGRSIAIECVIDTGFDGFILLPLSAVRAMGLPFLYRLDANLANDSTQSTPVYEAIILWQEVERSVQVLAMGKRPLIGTMLLDGNELIVQFKDNGLITIETL